MWKDVRAISHGMHGKSVSKERTSTVSRLLAAVMCEILLLFTDK